MDDWDQLTELGDCGALCGMTILDLQPPLILDLLWDAAQAMLDLLMPCSKIRAQLDRAEVESQGYTRDHIVRSRLA